MKPFLLDNNVLSELWKPAPAIAVLAWFEQAEWFLPAPVIAEIQQGAESVPSVARRTQINTRLDEFLSDYGALVLDWDAETSRTWGRLRHSPQVRHQPQPLWESLIDAMAVRYNATIATRNKDDFRHAEAFSPWDYVVRL